MSCSSHSLKIGVAFLLLFQLNQNGQFVSGANILFFNGMASHSHLVAFEDLANKLAERGHNVSILSPMISENKHPKVTHFRPLVVQDVLAQMDVMGELTMATRMESKHKDFFLDTTEIWYGSAELCRALYASQDFKEWLQSSTFDLIVIDNFQKQCGIPLAHKFGAKFILFMPSTLFYWDHDTFGLQTEPSFMLPWKSPHWLIPDSIGLEWQHLAWYFWHEWYLLPVFDEVVSSALAGPGEVFPSISQLQQQTALFLVNQHHTAEFARALPPFVVPVGGMHCRDAKEIKIMKIYRFLEDAKGFIYVSFGSFLKISKLPKEKQRMFFDAIQSFPDIKFLWKWGEEEPENLPKNVLTMKWYPQQDILGHPKCLGFVSQGGMMSYQQAVYHGVPMIIIPGGADQVFNGRVVETLGNGIHLELSEITTESFKGAISKLLENKKYQEKAKELSILFKDRPMSGVDTAVYWAEYVLRHDLDQLEHLKSPSMKQSWWRRRFIHGWAGLTILFVGFTLILGCVVCKLKKLLLGSPQRSKVTASNEKKKK